MADRYSIPIGTVLNRWTYLGNDRPANDGSTESLFRCSCGTERFVKRSSVKRGASKSCGCLKAEVARQMMLKHGRSQDPSGSAYATWSSMFARCYNPKSPSYSDYGGRGIKICNRWHKFENFLADMGERPRGTSIDRWPDKNGNYEPGNCRWATQTQQMYNTRRAHEIEIGDARATTADLAAASGVSIGRVRYRISRGMPPEKAMETGNLNERAVEFGGLSMSMAAWGRHLGLNRGTIEARIRRGKSIEEALAPVLPRNRKK